MISAPGGNSERQLGGIEFVLHRAAELHPSRVAIDDRLNGVRLTYRELHRRVISLARGLERLGVNRGDVVASAFHNEAAAIEMPLSCAMLGAISAPLNIRLSPTEARAYIALQRATTFVGRAAFHPFVDDAVVRRVVLRQGSAASINGAQFNDYDALLGNLDARPFPPRSSLADPYMIGMTSGTSGGSKGAVWSHGGCLLDMLSIIAHWQIRPGYKALCCAPAYHAAGLGWACMPLLWSAGTIVFPASVSFDVRDFFRIVSEEGIDCLFLVPAMVTQLYQQWDGIRQTGVKSIALAAAPVPKALRLKVAEMFPSAKKLVGYGMTECFSISMQEPDDFTEHGESVGEPALTARVRVVDDAGQEVARGKAGHVVARTLGQALYYNHDTANTAATFRPCVDDPEQLEWTRTGDIGMLAQDGRLTLLDRAKDIVITGGENVPSSEVESVLALHPGVVECAVIGIADEKWGEVVCAVIVSKALAPQRRELAKQLANFCRARLGSYKVPKRFVFLDSLPRNAFGKVLKRTLREHTSNLSLEGELP